MQTFQISSDRLIKLITILERNMRDVVSSDGTRLLVPIITEDVSDPAVLGFLPVCKFSTIHAYLLAYRMEKKMTKLSAN